MEENQLLLGRAMCINWTNTPNTKPVMKKRRAHTVSSRFRTFEDGNFLLGVCGRKLRKLNPTRETWGN
jgi:hypothetical protein